ncbi:hypothetical protein EON65_17595 [archaeon]|nr:MAG: hypothetical protein EON65_17595 [archaeon]
MNNVDINVLDYVGGMDESDTSPEISISLLNATNTRSLSQRQSGRFLCILTRVTPHICNYGVYTYFVQSVYAARHGYLMLPLLPDSSVPDYAYHRKLQPLIEALDTYSSICAYVVWLDSG